jgi:hypothetical protein
MTVAVWELQCMNILVMNENHDELTVVDIGQNIFSIQPKMKVIVVIDNNP